MLSLDVTSDRSVEAAVKEVVRRAGRIDALVNNAGFSVAPAGAEESSIEQARSIFDTNFFGIVRTTRAVVPQMRRLERPHTSTPPPASCRCRTGALCRDQARGRGIRVARPRAAHEGIRVSVIAGVERSARTPEPDATLMSTVRSSGVNKRVKEVMATADEPRVVAEVVLKAASAAHPKPIPAGRLRAACGSTARSSAGLMDGDSKGLGPTRPPRSPAAETMTATRCVDLGAAS
jgi:hypothetical protein